MKLGALSPGELYFRVHNRLTSGDHIIDAQRSGAAAHSRRNSA